MDELNRQNILQSYVDRLFGQNHFDAEKFNKLFNTLVIPDWRLRVAIRSYFRVKENGGGVFHGSIRDEVYKEIEEAAKEYGYGTSIVPGEIIIFHTKTNRALKIDKYNYMEV